MIKLNKIINLYFGHFIWDTVNYFGYFYQCEYKDNEQKFSRNGEQTRYNKFFEKMNHVAQIKF